MKALKFRGSALSDLRAFPETARREAGHQLDKVQNGQAHYRLEADSNGWEGYAGNQGPG